MPAPSRLRAVAPLPILLALPLLLLPPAGDAAAAADSREEGLAPAEILILGPLPAAPAAPPAPLRQGEEEAVPEIGPRGPFPAAGDALTLVPGRRLVWRRVAAAEGAFSLPPRDHWLAARLRCDRWTRLELAVATDAGATVWLDGEELGKRDAGEHDEPLVASGEAIRGTHDVLIRLAAPDSAEGTLAFGLSAAAEPVAGLAWSLERRRAPSGFRDERALASLQSLAVAPGGKLVARRLSRRNPEGEGRRASVAVLDAKGRVVAADLGGPDARPLAFAPDGRSLLLSRPGEEGRDLLLWSAPDGPVRIVLRDEPGLGFVRFAPGGRLLLLASTRGVAEEEVADEAPRRSLHARERVTDWTCGPHLHLLDLESGARRRLTRPGDHVLDDAAWLPDGTALIYGRTVPRAERPWFATEIRRLDLAGGEDVLLAEFSGGWEVRPQSFAVGPDGRALVFVGPPEQVGGGRAEHNVYNRQLWRLDLRDGGFARITTGLRQAFAGGGGLPAWRGEDLLVRFQEGSEEGIGRLERADGAWRLATLIKGGLGGAAVAPDASAVVFRLSAPARPAALHLLDELDGRSREPRLLEEPDAALAEGWLLAGAQDASCTGPDGDPVEAWWLPPTRRFEPDGEIPVVLYYYGGSSPTWRGFNFTFQWLAANGYAVLVVNPRGAYGYGDAFADHHAGDWGPRAAADILACLDAFLAAHPECDARKVGIYGGSYGGFMTGYLVSHTDRFAAAVSLYGISDLATYWGQGTWGWTYGDMALAGATPWSDPRTFLERSPLFRADRIVTPLLLLHGLADDNVTPGESAQLFTALAVQGKPVEMVLFPGEGHGISGSRASREEHRTMLLEWLDRWLRDQPEAWEARWE